MPADFALFLACMGCDMVVTEVIYRFILLLLLWHIVTIRILAKLFMLDESHY